MPGIPEAPPRAVWLWGRSQKAAPWCLRVPLPSCAGREAWELLCFQWPPFLMSTCRAVGRESSGRAATCSSHGRFRSRHRAGFTLQWAVGERWKCRDGAAREAGEEAAVGSAAVNHGSCGQAGDQGREEKVKGWRRFESTAVACGFWGLRMGWRHTGPSWGSLVMLRHLAGLSHRQNGNGNDLSPVGTRGASETRVWRTRVAPARECTEVSPTGAAGLGGWMLPGHGGRGATAGRGLDGRQRRLQTRDRDDDTQAFRPVLSFCRSEDRGPPLGKNSL